MSHKRTRTVVQNEEVKDEGDLSTNPDASRVSVQGLVKHFETMGLEATPQLTSQTPISSQRTTSSLHPKQEEGSSKASSFEINYPQSFIRSSSSSRHVQQQSTSEASPHQTNYPQPSNRSFRHVQQQTTPTEIDREVLQDTIPKTPESASLSSSSPSHVYPSTQSSSSNPATPQLTSQTPISSQRTTSSLHLIQEDGTLEATSHNEHYEQTTPRSASASSHTSHRKNNMENLEGQTQIREVSRVATGGNVSRNAEERSVASGCGLSSGTSIHIGQAKNTVLSARTVVQSQKDNRSFIVHQHHHPPPTTPNEIDREVLQGTIPKTPESASLPSSSPSHVYPSTQSTSSIPGPKKEFENIQKTIRDFYHPKHDVDVSNVDVSPENIPEIYPEMLRVDFYQGRFIPDDDNYNPKGQGIELSGSDRTVTIDQLVSDIQKNRFVSVIGYPGSGKTTLSKRLARRLSQNDDCIVLRMLFMEMNNGNDRLVLKEFLLGGCNYNFKDEEKNSAFECITDNPEHCFIILDGFDQISWTLEDNVKKSNYNTPLQYWELVSNLCLGKFLENCHLIFTSRPHAMLNIPKICRPKHTYFIRDLTFDNMKTLFHALINNQQQSKILWNNLTVKTPHLTSICHNPLMLQLYVRASLGSSQIDDISTMTRIFHTVLLNLKTSKHAVSISDDIVISLSKIAYEATKKGTVLITTNDLKKESLTSQLVQDLVVTLMGANREYALLEGQQRFYFSHQTFQEYFSALYICRRMSLRDFKLFVQNNLLEGHWSVVVQFTAGLLLDPIMNKNQSSTAMNQRPSDESTSAVTQPSTSSSQIASNLSSTAMNQCPSVESTSTLTQPSTSSSQIASNFFLQESQQLITQSNASNRPQSSSRNTSSSASQDSKPQPLKRRFPSLRKKIFRSNSTSKTTQQPLKASPSSQTPSSSHQPSSSATSSFQRSSFIFQLKSKTQTMKESVRSTMQNIFLRKPTDKKMQKRQLLVKRLLKETQKVAADHNEYRSITPITKILREGNDLEVTVTAGRHFDGGRIKMNSFHTPNEIHAVTLFLKSLPTRLEELDLFGCEMDSNGFLSWKEAIKSMPGSIVRIDLHGNYLYVDDVIEVLHKIEGEVVMLESLDDGDGRWIGRDPNKEEESKLQEALDRLDNKKLMIEVGRGPPLIHKNR